MDQRKGLAWSMRRIIFLILIILSSAGCSTISLRKVNYVALDNIDPQAVRREFALVIPQRLQVINTIVFQYKWLSFSALGYTDVNRNEKTFAVSCLNPVGIKLFELSGDSNSVKPGFVLKELLKKGDLPRVVGEDIRRIYFDTVPAPEAKVEKQKYKIIFSQPYGAGSMKYVFAGSQKLLIEKSYYEKKHCAWRVFYHEYRLDHGKFYPSVILLKNYRFGYNLIIRLKEVR